MRTLLLSLTVLAFVAAGCETSSEDDEHSTAYMLYVLDTDKLLVDEEANELRPYRRQLLLLSEKCTNSEERLGDMALTVKDALAEKFVDVSTLEVMEVVNAGLEGEPRRDCSEVFALAGVALEAGN